MDAADQQVCMTVGKQIFEIASYIVIGASVLVNKVPEPDKIKSKSGRAFSRIVHFLAIDVVTAKKPLIVKK